MCSLICHLDCPASSVGDIVERYESDSNGIVRSRLKLATDRSMNAQRYIWLLAFLSGRNLLPCKLVGRAVKLRFFAQTRLSWVFEVAETFVLVWPQSAPVRSQCRLQLLKQPLVRGIVLEARTLKNKVSTA